MVIGNFGGSEDGALHALKRLLLKFKHGFVRYGLNKNFLVTGFFEYGEIINLNFLCVFENFEKNEYHHRSFTIIIYVLQIKVEENPVSRVLHIRNIPRDVTESEVNTFDTLSSPSTQLEIF